MTENGWALQYVSKTLQNDREVVLAAVRVFREDKGVVLAAVRNGGLALQYAGMVLLLAADREVVLLAVQQNGWSLQYVSKTRREDDEVKKTVIKHCTKGNHREMVLAAVRSNGRALQYVPKALQNDRGVVLAAVEQDGGSFQYASETLQEDDEVAKTAMKHCLDEQGYPVIFDSVEQFRSHVVRSRIRWDPSWDFGPELRGDPSWDFGPELRGDPSWEPSWDSSWGPDLVEPHHHSIWSRVGGGTPLSSWVCPL